MKYMVQFNQYASQVGYGDNSLRHAFYHGLCTRIKDDMAHHGKPNNLCDMRFLAQELDARYWTRRTEISHENRESKSSGSYSNNPKSKGPSSNPSSSTSGPAPKSSDSNSSGSASNPKPYADKLGKDGCLTQEEKDRRRKNNLCMFCGGKHKTEDCNKRKATASAKGCAAEVEEPAPTSEDPAPDGAGKLEGSPVSSMRDQGCVDCNRTLEVVTLNAAALSNHSLTVSLSSEVGSGMESDDSPIIIILRFFALVDSGSSHFFIDSKYVEDHNLPTKPIPPVQLRLLDGSARSHISQSITLPVCFPSGNIISIDFYVTRLDSSCNIVLGYNWLSRCNPLID